MYKSHKCNSFPANFNLLLKANVMLKNLFGNGCQHCGTVLAPIVMLEYVDLEFSGNANNAVNVRINWSYVGLWRHIIGINPIVCAPVTILLYPRWVQLQWLPHLQQLVPLIYWPCFCLLLLNQHQPALTPILAIWSGKVSFMRPVNDLRIENHHFILSYYSKTLKYL